MKILFVCSGNTCRSPMAEAITRQQAAARGIALDVSSAGLRAEERIAPEAARALADRGITVTDRAAVQLVPEMVERADLTLCATARHRDLLRDALGTAAERVHVWAEFVGAPPDPVTGADLDDPIGKGAAAYEATAARMDVLAGRLLDLLESSDRSGVGERESPAG